MDLSNITVNKQSSIRIAGSKVLYFDAFEIKEEQHDADFIFVTHEHFDHFDVNSINNIITPESKIIAPLSMKKKLLSDLKIEEGRCLFCEPGEEIEVEGVKIKAIPAYNILKPFHMKSSKWVGYLVDMDEKSYYIAGDTDANEDVRNVKCDVALLPVGGKFTMDYKQATELVCEMKPKAVIPTHYGEVVGKPTNGADFMKLVNAFDAEIQVELKIM